MSEQLDFDGPNYSQHFTATPVKPPLDPQTFWGPQPFGDLPLFSFDLIMCDPPWLFENYSDKGKAKSADAHYTCLPDPVIAALPVGHLAARDAILFLWATSPKLEFAYTCVRAWGFRPVTMGFWVKRTRHDKVAFGTGYRARNAGDPWIIGVAGKPDTSRSERNVIQGPLREHTRKPEQAFRWCERYMPGRKRVELFSWQSRPGWHTWGNEKTKFDHEVPTDA